MDERCNRVPSQTAASLRRCTSSFGTPPGRAPMRPTPRNYKQVRRKDSELLSLCYYSKSLMFEEVCAGILCRCPQVIEGHCAAVHRGLHRAQALAQPLLDLEADADIELQEDDREVDAGKEGVEHELPARLEPVMNGQFSDLRRERPKNGKSVLSKMTTKSGIAARARCPALTVRKSSPSPCTPP